MATSTLPLISILRSRIDPFGGSLLRKTLQKGDRLLGSRK